MQINTDYRRLLNHNLSDNYPPVDFPSDRWCKIMSIIFVFLCLILLLLILLAPFVLADTITISLSAIERIESASNPAAFNRSSGARGLYQITPVVLQEYNNYNNTRYTVNNLYIASVNKMIAVWYLSKRIPQLLTYYKKSITVENILKSYNSGIRSVIKNYLPAETKKYIAKYNRLTKEKK